jgi:hypothetical protein
MARIMLLSRRAIDGETDDSLSLVYAFPHSANILKIVRPRPVEQPKLDLRNWPTVKKLCSLLSSF